MQKTILFLLYAIFSVSLHGIEEKPTAHFDMDQYNNLTITFDTIKTRIIIPGGPRPDITQAPVDAIVRPCDQSLYNKNYVSEHINKQAGRSLLVWELYYNQSIIQKIQIFWASLFNPFYPHYGSSRDVQLPIGQAAISSSFKLLKKNNIKYIIHAAGPDIQEVQQGTYDNYLADVWLHSLELAAKKKDIMSIAFPSISTNYQLFPAWAAPIAMATLITFLQQNPNRFSVIMLVTHKIEREPYIQALKDLVIEQ